MGGKKSGSFMPFLVLLAVFLAVGPTVFPNFFWHILMVADYAIPSWHMFHDPYVQMYHSYLVSRLPDRPEMPAPELPLEKATAQSLREMSKGFTVPLIIRGAVKDIPALQTWKNATWWIENYGNEEVLCKYIEGIVDGEVPACTVKQALGSMDGKREGRLYITGESKIFQRRPELQAMVDSQFLSEIEPGKRVFTQLFLGYNGMGSDIHSAIGCNLFRMIAGRKKWWLLPQTQTPYVYASLNPNGFSSHTKTKIGKGKETASPWLKKLERYTVVLEPGDMLLNTAWYWHGILNIADSEDELVIGVPTRYSVDNAAPAFKSNFLLSAIAMQAIQKQYDGLNKFTSNAANLQNGIERARTARANSMKSAAAKMDEIEVD